LIDPNLYFDLVAKKSDYLHIEGIAHASFALKQSGNTSSLLWDKLHAQILKKDTFAIELVKNENYDPTKFELAGKKGGLMNRATEHILED